MRIFTFQMSKGPLQQGIMGDVPSLFSSSSSPFPGGFPSKM